MKTKTKTLFDGTHRLNMIDSIQYTIDSLNQHGKKHKHWCIAWSGGKDSTALVTLVVWLIDSGKIDAPEKLTVMYADTRMELTPLYLSARGVIEDLEDRGIEVKIVMADLEKRFLPYILGRGVPPPNNNTFRWCTRQIKIDPMKVAIAEMHDELKGDFLMLTGVRQGESAIRDQRIILSCSKDGSECGQGWYQTMNDKHSSKLAPILHWRVCHIWEWLKHWAVLPEYGDWDTRILADAYGGDEAEEKNCRTGCVGCPLASKDKALTEIIKVSKWSYLKPLLDLRPIYRELRKPKMRLRKDGTQRNKDGSIPKNPQRMGPLTMEARKWAFDGIMKIQEQVNLDAVKNSSPTIDLLNEKEITYIKHCWKNNVYPDKWTGNEPRADKLIDKIFSDGTVQPLLFH